MLSVQIVLLSTLLLSGQVSRPIDLERLIGDGSFSKVAEYVSHHSQLNDRDGAGKTALFYAVEAGRPDIVELLLHKGANPNLTFRTSKQTCLMVAAGSGSSADSAECARLLISNGAKPDARDINGSTALLLHPSNRTSIAFIDLMLKAGANINAKDHSGTTLLSKMRRLFPDQHNVIDFLVRKGGRG